MNNASGAVVGAASNVVYYPASNTHVITYTGEFKGDFFLQDLAPSLVKTFGEKRIAAFGEFFSYLFPPVPVLFSFLLVGYLSSSGFPPLGDTFVIFSGAAFGALGILLGGQLSRVADYHRDARCRGCWKPFACVEFEKPEIRELSTPYSYSINVTRYWKCRHCGCEEARSGDEGIVARKGDESSSSFLNKAICKSCGKKAAYEEFKRPDVKEVRRCLMVGVFTTRYYRCRHCGHEKIGVEKQHI